MHVNFIDMSNETRIVLSEMVKAESACSYRSVCQSYTVGR